MARTKPHPNGAVHKGPWRPGSIFRGHSETCALGTWTTTTRRSRQSSLRRRSRRRNAAPACCIRGCAAQAPRRGVRLLLPRTAGRGAGGKRGVFRWGGGGGDGSVLSETRGHFLIQGSTKTQRTGRGGSAMERSPRSAPRSRLGRRGLG